MLQRVESQRASVLNALFENYDGPVFSIRLWDGWHWSSSVAAKPVCTIVVRNPQALTSLVVGQNEIALGEAFIHSNLDVEGDIFSVFSIAEHILARPRSLREKILERAARGYFAAGRWLRHGSRHSQNRDRAAIAYHYNQPISFYRPWLGQSLAYSCAYFRNRKDPLDLAQEQKLDLICRKLRLQPLGTC